MGANGIQNSYKCVLVNDLNKPPIAQANTRGNHLEFYNIKMDDAKVLRAGASSILKEIEREKFLCLYFHLLGSLLLKPKCSSGKHTMCLFLLPKFPLSVRVH